LFLQSRESFSLPGLPPVRFDLKRPKKVWEWEAMRSALDAAFMQCQPGTDKLPLGWANVRRRKLLTTTSSRQMRVNVTSKYCDGQKLRPVLECPVLRPVWETKWNEEWAVLVRTTAALAVDVLYLLIYQANTKSPAIIVCSSDILAVRAVPETSPNPFTTAFPAVEIELKGRVLLFGLATGTLRSQFISSIQQHIGFVPDRVAAGLDDVLLSSDMTTVSLGLESNRWGPQRRSILNARRLPFPTSDEACFNTNSGTGATAASASTSTSSGCFNVSHPAYSAVLDPAPAFQSGDPEMDLLHLRKQLQTESDLKPWELTAILLRSALELTDDTSLEDQIRFFDHAARLRHLDIVRWSRVMTEEEKICFALNLYHAMRLHAKFLVGQPSSILGWASFGSRVSYAIGAGANAIVLSLAEIEHCVLRKPMSLARSILSTTHPDSPFTNLLQLTRPEPRINFALNYGTRSSSPNVLVLYSPSQVDKLLDLAAADFLAHQLKVDVTKGLIGIPKIASWYGKDFVTSSSADLNTKRIAKEIILYTGAQQREIIQRLLRHEGISFKVRSFRWKALGVQHELIA
ncbi:SCL-interrupting locus protein-like, partial [Durusdinium trenchii]